MMRAFVRRELLRSELWCSFTVFQIRLTPLLARALHFITVQNPLRVVG